MVHHILLRGGERLKHTKLYICSAVFIILTAIKLTSPELSENISHEIKAAFEDEMEDTDTLLAIGSSLTSGSFFEAFFENEDDVIEVDVHTNDSPRMVQASSQKGLELKLPKLPTASDFKRAVFICTQSRYSEYGLPTDVSYDMLTLELEYENPIDGVRSSGFGYRMHPIKNEVKFHYGTDLAAAEGTEIRAFADGTVIAAGYDDGYGNYIVMTHENGYRTLYAHCSELRVGCGSISRGDVIALVGQTGSATGPHLHFELQCNGVYLNPEFYI